MTLSSEKKKTWKVFSEYIRLRDCLETTGREDMGKCCTCGRVYPFKKLQAGRWLPGRHSSVLFDEQNCHAQCYECNIEMKGNPVRYCHFMEEKYGLEVMATLKQIDSRPEKFKSFELIHMRDEFKALIQALKNKKRE